ncbi:MULTISPECIES: hypothetical protein [Variovorax]|jgi:heme/copper-type cytochrome/quinol oxidase subunit 3|uniref:hypothetical protein n=1 Tax=Variovorax TaxID=34072 RepID=UPI0008CC05D6|nr:hypothetical protein [Variovorax sp. OV084]SEU23261.1 hypothetical protein SAMN05443580_13619 [Variovorax sp. OV084]
MTNQTTPRQTASRQQSLQHSRNDDRDNSRVFAFFIVVAVMVFVGALAYFFIVDKRARESAREVTPPAAHMHGTAPRPAGGTSPGTSSGIGPAGSPPTSPVR